MNTGTLVFLSVSIADDGQVRMHDPPCCRPCVFPPRSVNGTNNHRNETPPNHNSHDMNECINTNNITTATTLITNGDTISITTAKRGGVCFLPELIPSSGTTTTPRISLIGSWLF